MYGFERKKMSVFEEIAYAIRLDGEKWLFFAWRVVGCAKSMVNGLASIHTLKQSAKDEVE